MLSEKSHAQFESFVTQFTIVHKVTFYVANRYFLRQLTVFSTSKYLHYHAEIALRYADILISLYDDSADEANLAAAKENYMVYLRRNEEAIQPVFDVWANIRHLTMALYKKSFLSD